MKNAFFNPLGSHLQLLARFCSASQELQDLVSRETTTALSLSLCESMHPSDSVKTLQDGVDDVSMAFIEPPIRNI